MRKFVIGDIHGNYKALLQCLQRSEFNYKKDKLIVLGDTCDGLPEVKECFDELLKIEHLVYILGNHDEWALEWYDKEIYYQAIPKNIWTSQGGMNTLRSYGGLGTQMHKKHVELLKSAKVFYLEYDYDDRSLFVHGGINPNKPLSKQDRDLMLWDRDLLEYARKKHNQRPDYKYGQFNEIYVGHTTTQLFYKRYQDGYENPQPLKFCNVCLLDTGAGWDGKLTIMDIITKEYWQSDLVSELYPYYQGRGNDSL